MLKHTVVHSPHPVWLNFSRQVIRVACLMCIDDWYLDDWYLGVGVATGVEGSVTSSALH